MSEASAATLARTSVFMGEFIGSRSKGSTNNRHRCPRGERCTFGDTCRFKDLPNGHGEETAAAAAASKAAASATSA